MRRARAAPGGGLDLPPTQAVRLARTAAGGTCYSAPVSVDGPENADSRPEGLLDLLGLLAYASLTAFFRVSDDAALALSLAGKSALADLAVAQFGHFQLLSQRIRQLGAEPEDAIPPFVSPVDEFHARTAPSDS